MLGSLVKLQKKILPCKFILILLTVAGKVALAAVQY